MIFNTTQIVFDNWPTDALKEVANKFLEASDVSNIEMMSNYFAFVH